VRAEDGSSLGYAHRETPHPDCEYCAAAETA
jgi:hypothetical protein